MRKSVLFAASVLIGVLAGCGDTAAPVAAPAATGQPESAAAVEPEPAATPTAGSTAATTAAPAPTRTLTAKPAATTRKALPVSGCPAVAGARVLGSEAPYGDHAAGLPLSGGVWSQGGEKLAAQKPCTTGKLENLDGPVTLATLLWSTEGTTGRWWAIALCGPGKTGTQCIVQDILEDREPVQSVKITGGEAVVVYLTRTEDVPAAGVNLRRTAVYRYHGNGLTQTSFTDEPYTP